MLSDSNVIRLTEVIKSMVVFALKVNLLNRNIDSSVAINYLTNYIGKWNKLSSVANSSMTGHVDLFDLDTNYVFPSRNIVKISSKKNVDLITQYLTSSSEILTTVTNLESWTVTNLLKSLIYNRENISTFKIKDIEYLIGCVGIFDITNNEQLLTVKVDDVARPSSTGDSYFNFDIIINSNITVPGKDKAVISKILSKDLFPSLTDRIGMMFSKDIVTFDNNNRLDSWSRAKFRLNDVIISRNFCPDIKITLLDKDTSTINKTVLSKLRELNG